MKERLFAKHQLDYMSCPKSDFIFGSTDVVEPDDGIV